MSRRGSCTHLAGSLGNGWMLSGIGQFRSGLPYTMRTSGSLAEEFSRPPAPPSWAWGRA